MLNSQLQLDFLVSLHVEIFNAATWQDSMFSETFTRFMQVDMKALRRSGFFIHFTDIVVSQRQVVTRIFPLKMNFLLYDQAPFKLLSYRNARWHFRFHCEAAAHWKVHWWLNFNVFRVPIQAIPTEELVSRVSCLFKHIRERIVVEGEIFPRLIQRWMPWQVVFLWSKCVYHVKNY